MKPSFAQPKNISEDQTSNPKKNFLNQASVHKYLGYSWLRSIKLNGHIVIIFFHQFLRLPDTRHPKDCWVQPPVLKLAELFKFSFCPNILEGAPNNLSFNAIMTNAEFSTFWPLIPPTVHHLTTDYTEYPPSPSSLSGRRLTRLRPIRGHRTLFNELPQYSIWLQEWGCWR